VPVNSLARVNGAGPDNAHIRVLGIDPAASGPTGYGVIESDGRNSRMLHYGALVINPRRQKESSGAALQDVHDLLSRLIDEYAPDVLAVEAVFASLNVRTALRLAEVRGVVLLAAAQHNIAVHSYSPREVKSSVAGYGHADKSQVQQMVRRLLTMDEIPEPTDAADALAVALCHLQAEQTRRRFGLPQDVALVSKVRSRKTPRGARTAPRLTPDCLPADPKICTTHLGVTRIEPAR
jgi:crossover junction endodeoxyribonuclease RuvC